MDNFAGLYFHVATFHVALSGGKFPLLGGITFKSALLPPYPHFLSLGQLPHSHGYQNEPKLN